MQPLKNRSSYTLSVDCVIFGYVDDTLQVALIKRKNEPFKGMWAIPGGFVHGDETIEQAAFRELEEETGIHDLYLEQFHVFSDPERDPRGRVITIGLFALIPADALQLVATEDALEAEWFPAHKIPSLAFDHQEIYAQALEALRVAVRIKPLLFKLLPQEFTLGALQNIYEQIFDITVDKRNFRKKILALNYIKETTKIMKGMQHRPARLYKFSSSQYEKNKADIPSLLM